MRFRVVSSAAFVLTVVLSGVVPGWAEGPAPALAPLPSNGFVPPYEVMRNVRAVGLDPLAPPLREGSTYVLRATDFSGALMRVVVDAHSGAIRDANRIVPGPGSYPDLDNQLGIAAPSQWPPDAPPADGRPLAYGPTTPEPNPETLQPPPRVSMRASLINPPLPRPRPAKFAARRSTTANEARKAAN